MVTAKERVKKQLSVKVIMLLLLLFFLRFMQIFITSLVKIP